jgi:hypothetical protein
MDIDRIRKLAGIAEDDDAVESSWTPSGTVWSLWVSFPYEGRFLCGLYSSKDLARQAWDEMANSPRLERNGSLSLEELSIDDAPNLRYF